MLASKPAASFDSWDHLVQGRRLLETFHRQEVEEAREHLHTAIQLDPGLAEAYAYLGFCHFVRGWAHWVEPERAEFDQAVEWARRATQIDLNNGIAHEVLSVTYLFRGEHDRGTNEARLALEANPNSLLAHFSIGNAAVYSGHPADALQSFALCLDLDPLGLWAWVLHAISGVAHYLLGDYDEAIGHTRDAIAIRSGYLLARVFLTASLARIGAIDEARVELAHIFDQP